MKIALDFHDLSPKNHNVGLLEEMREHYPSFKVTLFLTPWECRWKQPTPITDSKYKLFCKAIKEIVKDGWVEIGIHGLTHAQRRMPDGTIYSEFDGIDYEQAKSRLIVAEKMLQNVKIPFVKLFIAPFWQISPSAELAVKELGFRICGDKEYNWNLSEDFPKRKRKVWGHGHIQNTCGNGLEESMPRLLQIPQNAEWVFLSEYLK